MRRAVLAVGAIATVLIAAAPVAHAVTATDAWTSEYAGAQNAAYNAGETVIRAATARRLAQVWVRSAAEGTYVAPAIVGGVVYHAVNTATAAPSTFVATSARTGKTLWTTRLPTDGTYVRGQSIQGHLAVLPFDGFHYAGGVTVIDLRTHKIVWSRHQPEPGNTSNGADDRTSGPVLVDAYRIYMYDGSNAVNVFRLSDGARLWHLPQTTAWVRGAALNRGVLYTGGDGGVIAYSAATGRKLWSAPGWGPPIVAGGRVFSALLGGVVADAAGGCGRARCRSLWTRNFGDVTFNYVALGAASSTSLYAAYTVDGASGRYGRLQRLSAATGAVQWTGSAGVYPGQPVRAGDTVWTVDNGATLYGFSVNATSRTPLVRRTEPGGHGVAQGTAIAGGTLVIQIWPSTLVGYRIPGT